MNLAIPLALVTLNTALCLGPSLALAAEQEPEPPRRPGRPVEGDRVQRPMQGQPRPGGLPFEAVLTPEQRIEFREAMMSHRETLRELEEKSGPLRRELDEALFADPIDEIAVREKSAALAVLEAERSLIRARVFAKIRPSLSEEQLERLKNLRAEGARGPRIGDGEPRRFREGGSVPEDRPQRPRGPRPPTGESELDVLPPPAPRPPAPPPPAPR